jgi:3-hydroxybutyryl-CoA dehydrogenase
MKTGSAKLHVAVIGAGSMGRGIAESAVASGATVVLVDKSQNALDSAVKRIRSGLIKETKPGYGDADISDVMDRLVPSTDMSRLAGCQLVIEAVPEIAALKVKVLGDVESHADTDTVIASNTSSIPITQLARGLSRPEQFLGIHFFNPVPRMRLVELISGVRTSRGTEEFASSFVTDVLAKTVLSVKDRPGFVVNALLIPYLLAAANMLDIGYASAEEIDHGMELGCGHPLGPLRLADYIGLDVLCDVADALHVETRSPSTIVPNNIRRLVEAGHLGRKTAQGFYEYDN